MTVAIVNPGSGNITSICDALSRLNRSFRVLETPSLQGIGQIVLPGQGRFGPVMRFLRERGWVQPLRQWVEEGKPLVGICVGMQALFEGSDEDPDVPGLGIFRGRSEKLAGPKHPMIGWARVHWRGGKESSAYFVNSYAVPSHPRSIATTTYGNAFCAAIAQDGVRAYQFHPEKSGVEGKELLASCLIF